jgi:hypothetical protein
VVDLRLTTNLIEPADRMQPSTSDWSKPSDAASICLVVSEQRRRASLAVNVVKSPSNTTSTLWGDTVGVKVGEVVGSEVVGALVVGAVVTGAYDTGAVLPEGAVVAGA